MSRQKNLIPSKFFPTSSSESDGSSESESDSVKYNPPRCQTSQARHPVTTPSGPGSQHETFCPIQTHVQGEKFSKSDQVEFRVQIHPMRMIICQEQSVYTIETNITISNMDSYCMFLQINKEECFHNEFRLFTTGFISPSYNGNLFVKIKNIDSYTKVLYPSDIIGYLTIQPFIMKT